VIGINVRRAELAGFVAAEKDGPTGFFCVALKLWIDGQVGDYPMPSSSAASNTVPHFRQMTAPQSPQIKGSETSAAHLAQ
jgi:hypothetical protein